MGVLEETLAECNLDLYRACVVDPANDDNNSLIRVLTKP
jgi:hypothetical protein